MPGRIFNPIKVAGRMDYLAGRISNPRKVAGRILKPKKVAGRIDYLTGRNGGHNLSPWQLRMN